MTIFKNIQVYFIGEYYHLESILITSYEIYFHTHKFYHTFQLYYKFIVKFITFISFLKCSRSGNKDKIE